MPGILLYEYTCSSGQCRDDGISRSLAAEGRAMLVALAADLLAASCNTVVIWDRNLGPFPLAAAHTLPIDCFKGEYALFSRDSPHFDWTIAIAPETDGRLAERCRWVESAGGRLLGCSAALAELLSDKSRTAEHLAANEVPVPRGHAWEPGEPPPSLPCTVVVKPRDGAGSENTLVVKDPSALGALLAHVATSRLESKNTSPARRAAYRFCAARVVVYHLCHVFRRLDSSSTRTTSSKKVHACGKSNISAVVFHFPSDLARRAIGLARRAVTTLPQPLGYLGVDLVLGDRHDGGRDFVIEINPRLTTSYVGLRAASRSNLAQAMLDVAEGRLPSLSFNNECNRI